MPTYEHECNCGNVFEELRSMSQSHQMAKCPACGAMAARVILTPPAGRMDPTDWQSENSGRGRYITQLQRTIGSKVDNNAYCRTRQEARDKAEKLGCTSEVVG